MRFVSPEGSALAVILQYAVRTRFYLLVVLSFPIVSFFCGSLLLCVEKYRHLRAVIFEVILRRCSGFTAPAPRMVLGWKFYRRSERVLPLGGLIAWCGFGTEYGEVPLFAIRRTPLSPTMGEREGAVRSISAHRF